MKSKAAVLFYSLVLGLPLMVGFQNCAKVPAQNASVAADVSSAYKAANIDTSLLPQNATLPVEQPGSSAGNISQYDVNYQVEDPKIEDQKDVAEAIASCADLSQSANENNQASYSNDSASGIRVKKSLSKEDFGGNSHIKSVSDSYGKIFVCDLEIDSLDNSGGKVILINSRVHNLTRFHGQVHVVGNSAIAGNIR